MALGAPRSVHIAEVRPVPKLNYVQSRFDILPALIHEHNGQIARKLRRLQPIAVPLILRGLIRDGGLKDAGEGRRSFRKKKNETRRRRRARGKRGVETKRNIGTAVERGTRIDELEKSDPVGHLITRRGERRAQCAKVRFH